MRLLGIESSCDETGAAIVEDGRHILANVVASQASIHERYGGVVPEVASRQQLSAIIPVLETALREAGLGWADLDGVAATYGPGLAGSLLVGLTAGKALSLARNLPFIGVNHLEAHIYANWLLTDTPPTVSADAPADDHHPADPQFPLLALVISGAHTELVFIPQHGRYELLGQTLDDAAGEAFDKVARLLGLGYPGGPAIEQAARLVAATTTPTQQYHLPRAKTDQPFDFSFSGLKTAVLEMVEGARHAQATNTEAMPRSSTARRATRYEQAGAAAAQDGAPFVPALAAAFQYAVSEALTEKTVRAARECGVHQVVLAGGVAANVALRERLRAALSPLDVALRYPPIAFCTDNAAMIASAGYFHLRLGERHGYDLDVTPGLQLPFAQDTALSLPR